ncbi:MAG: Lsm family RNA-binding protein [Candidatus Bathyarchaeia archaeon]
MSVAQRRLFKELTDLMDKTIMTITMDGQSFTGTLIGVDPETLTICLADVKSSNGKTIHRVLLNGKTVSRILTVEKPFDLKALAERLEKVFPTMVDTSNIDKGFIWVMGKIKVTEKGVVEGSGPAAERVMKVYELFLSESKG